MEKNRTGLLNEMGELRIRVGEVRDQIKSKEREIMRKLSECEEGRIFSEKVKEFVEVG